MLWELGSSALAQVPELGRFICLLSDCLSSKIAAPIQIILLIPVKIKVLLDWFSPQGEIKL